MAIHFNMRYALQFTIIAARQNTIKFL